MALVHALGQFTITSGSSTAISPTLTWNDAGTHTPQALLIFYHNGAAGTGTGDLFHGIGMTDGTRHFATGYAIDDANATTTASGMNRTASSVLLEVDTVGAVTGRVGFTSFGTDTFTLTPSDAFTNTCTAFYVAFSGYDNVYVDQEAMAGATGNYSKTGVGFQANAGIFLYGASATLDTASTFVLGSLGIATGASNQSCVLWRTRSGQTTDYTIGQVLTSGVMASCGDVAAAHSSENQFVSFDSDGYTLNRIAGTSLHQYGVLLLKGGVALATSTAAQTSVGTFNVTASGQTPSFALAIANNTATAAQTTGVEGYNVSFGALTGSAQWALNFHDFNNEVINTNATELYRRSDATKFMVHYDRASADSFTAVGEITSSAFSANTLTLNQTDADTAAVLIPILIIGAAPAGGSSIAAKVAYYRMMGMQ